MTKLKDIDYTDIQNLCIKYCIDRLGLDLSIKDFKEIADRNKTAFTKIEELNRGDIILRGCENPSFTYSKPLIIKNRVIDRPVNTQYHCLVYEGDNTFSDAIIDDNYFLTIRMRLFEDLPTVQRTWKVPRTVFN